MNDVVITDSLIYFIWAYQGVMIESADAGVDEDSCVVHVTVPRTSDLKDRSGRSMDGYRLLNTVQQTCKGLSYANMRITGTNTVYSVSVRDEHWSKDKISDSVLLTMYALFNGFDSLQL